MKKSFIIKFMIFLFLISFFGIVGYKFFIVGHNKNIEDVKELDEYILNINDYETEAKVTVYSNKTQNTYGVKQYKKGDYQKQEIFEDSTQNGIIIENDNETLRIKNTLLSTERVFNDYRYVLNNAVCLNVFINDYVSSEEKLVEEDETYYILKVKNRDSKNKYTESKELYFNKHNNQIEKIKVKDVNNNVTILIEYTKFRML